MNDTAMTGAFGGGSSLTGIPDALRSGRIGAVLRAPSAEHFLAATDVLITEGIRVIKVTLTTQGGVDALRSIVGSAPPGVAVGAGSVMSVSQAEMAMDAGTQFLVSPVTQPDVLCRRTHGWSADVPGPTATFTRRRSGRGTGVASRSAVSTIASSQEPSASPSANIRS